MFDVFVYVILRDFLIRYAEIWIIASLSCIKSLINISVSLTSTSGLVIHEVYD